MRFGIFLGPEQYKGQRFQKTVEGLLSYGKQFFLLAAAVLCLYRLQQRSFLEA